MLHITLSDLLDLMNYGKRMSVMTEITPCIGEERIL